MRYYRDKGKWSCMYCIGAGFFIILPQLMFFAIEINPHVAGLLGFLVILLLLIFALMHYWVSRLPRCFLRLTLDGLGEYGVVFSRLYPLRAIQRYEVIHHPYEISGRYRPQLFLFLTEGVTRIPLFKYGIDTMSEITSFIKVLETYLANV